MHCTFIDRVEVLPLTSNTMRFRSHTGDEVLQFGCDRSTAAKLAYDILRAIEAADMAELGEVVPIGRAG